MIYFLYAKNHYVFITVVTYNRNHVLIKNINNLRQCIKRTKDFYDYEIFAAVILPDHFHMIIKPSNPIELSKIIAGIKRRFTKSLDESFIDKEISVSRIKRNEKGVWQRRFYNQR